MRRQSQIIVLLDVMFIFLFILIIKPTKQATNIKFDNYLNIPYTVIFAFDKDKDNIYIYENTSWKHISLSKIKEKYPINLVYTNNREVYKKLPKIAGNFKIKTYVYNDTKNPDDLYDRIMRKSFTKCVMKDECKQNITLKIEKSGDVKID